MMPTAVVSRIASRSASVSARCACNFTWAVTSERKLSVAARPSHSMATALICSQATSPVVASARKVYDGSAASPRSRRR